MTTENEIREELEEELKEAKERIQYLETRLNHSISHNKRLYAELQNKGFRRKRKFKKEVSEK